MLCQEVVQRWGDDRLWADSGLAALSSWYLRADISLNQAVEAEELRKTR